MAESQRAEASRRGVTVYQVRTERAEARGFRGSQARRLGAGKPRGEEAGLATRNMLRDFRSNPTKDSGRKLSRSLEREARRLGITVHQAWTLFVASPK